MEHCGYKELVPTARLTLQNMTFLSQKLKKSDNKDSFEEPEWCRLMNDSLTAFT